MGTFIGTCLLAMAGAFVATEIWGGFEGAAAMGGATLGAFAGAVLGLGGALWSMLHKGGHWGGKAVAALTGTAIMVTVCLAFVAFS